MITLPSCDISRPAPIPKKTSDTANALVVTVPPGGLVLRAEGGAAPVGVQRFAAAFATAGRLGPSGAAVLRIPADRAGRPWQVRVAPADRATVCGLA